jgi:hypothetical protein
VQIGLRLHLADQVVFIDREEMELTRLEGEDIYRWMENGIRIEQRIRPIGQGFLLTTRLDSDAPLGILRVDSLAFLMDPPRATSRVVFLGRSKDLKGRHQSADWHRGRLCVKT